MSDKRVFPPLIFGCLLLSACSGQAVEVANFSPSAASVQSLTAEPVEGLPGLEETAVAGPSQVAVYDIFQNGNLQMIVLGWSNVAPTESIRPRPGNKIIEVDLVAVNLGKSLFELNNESFTIEDSNSRVFTDPVDLKNAEDHYSNNIVFPGERLYDVLGFEVPENATRLTLVMAADASNHFRRIQIDLGSHGAIRSAPATLAGERQPFINPAGSTATCGYWKVQISGILQPPVADPYLELIPSGHNLLLVGLNLDNTDSAARGRDAIGAFWLQTSFGRRYGENSSANVIAGGQVQGDFLGPDTELSSGAQLRAWLGFSVPENPGSLRLVYWCGNAGQNHTADKVDLALPAA